MQAKAKGYLISIVAISWSLMQIYNAIFFDWDLLQVEVMHITLALVLVFLLRANRKWPWLDYVLVLASAASGAYFLYSYPRIIERIRFVSDVLPSDIVACVVVLFLVLEAGRRLMGWGLSILGLVAIAYAALGGFIPGFLGHSSVTLDSFSEFMVLTQEGLFGIPLRVSTTYVFLFVLFGAFLKYGRLGEFYNDLAVSVAGGLRGGPGKVAVISSSLLGTISGSAVANVATSGAFTIPMMKRAGYSPTSAGAIEALASTGSQIVPPIMGAAAFIMADLTRIPYWSIAIAAIIPSILYYLVVYAAVHFEAVRSNLEADSEVRKPLLGLVSSKGYMFVPIVVIIYYLAAGYSIPRSASMAILASFVISAIPIVAKGQWEELMIFVRALEDGAKSAISVAVPCAIAGVIVGVLTLTGLGLKFTDLILGAAGHNIFWMLLITSLICLILGMGMPTSAAYITVAILAIPALIKAGVPTITAHFFGFYFANLSMITPPVALAAYAGAGIAGANSAEVGLRACRLGITLYAVPFLLATYPPLMLLGPWQQIIYALVLACPIAVCLTAAFMGIMARHLNYFERALFLAAGVLLWASMGKLYIALAGFVVLAAALALVYRPRLLGRTSA